jgi:hypothetical protein
VLTTSTRGNTGDGVHVAQVWHFRGCSAFKHPDPNFPFALRVKRLPDWNPAKKSRADVKMVWIVVDRSGCRYRNESPPCRQEVTNARIINGLGGSVMRR